ncbi:MAG: cytochrome c oxidase assembly protein [Ktedonobacteraceae bacterium]
MNIWVDAYGWPFPPTVLLGCLVAEFLYFRGWNVLVQQERAMEAARTTPSAVFSGFIAGKYRWDSWFWRSIYFLAAILVFLLAASNPIDVLSGRLFWVHMVQHLLLLVVMAPLLVAGAPLIPVWLGLPDWVRRFAKTFAQLKIGRACYQIGHWLRQPAVSCAVLVIGIWVWHWPPLYDLALTNDVIHDWCEHLTFQLVSILFWTQVIPSPPLQPCKGYIGRIGCIGVAIVQNLILAVLIAFAQTPLYAAYAHLGTIAGGFSALQDQQFGAGIMWTFGDLPFGIAFSILLHRWLISQSDDEGEVNAGEKQRA